MSKLYQDIVVDGEPVTILNHCLLATVDRKWAGKHMFCSKHNYGPMDSWYNCGECCNETMDEFEAHQASDEYKEGWELIRRGAYSDGISKVTCPSRRKLLRYYKMSTILKKIPPDAAEEWIATFT
jgi:hypothetical protein